MVEENTTGKSCGNCASGFNYCFWAKLLVGVLAIPLIGMWGASFFKDPTTQILMGGVTAFIAIYLAVIIDRLPFLQKKIVDRK